MLLASLALPASAHASIIIDFESYPGGAPTVNQDPISNQYASLGVVFSGSNVVIQFEPGQATSGVMTLQAYPPPQPLTIDFFTLASLVEFELISVGDSAVTIAALDA